MESAAIIVAAGQGLRLGGPMPKQYQALGAEPVLTRTLRAMLAAPVDAVLVAIHPDARGLYDAAAAPVDDPRLLPPVAGGATRAQSVRRALEALEPHAPARVLVHDAARPFVAPADIAALLAAEGAAILAEPLVDALWREADGMAAEPVPRAGLWRAQTPQAFPFAALLAAHRPMPRRRLRPPAGARRRRGLSPRRPPCPADPGQPGELQDHHRRRSRPRPAPRRPRSNAA